MFGAIKRGLRMVVPLKVNLVKNAFVYIQRMKVKNITGSDEKFLARFHQITWCQSNNGWAQGENEHHSAYHHCSNKSV
jgi:hypothetical protein